MVPIEWREKSGTAHTVKYAAQQEKALMCVRLPDWNGRDELKLAAEMGAEVFTVPGDEERLLQFVDDVLNEKLRGGPQLALPL